MVLRLDSNSEIGSRVYSKILTKHTRILNPFDAFGVLYMVSNFLIGRYTKIGRNILDIPVQWVQNMQIYLQAILIYSHQNICTYLY